MEYGVIILAAGIGSRMKSKTSKVFHKICGVSMFEIVLDLAVSAYASQIVVVASEENREEIAQTTAIVKDVVVQKDRLGTGHAVLQALHTLKERGRTFILYADTPLVKKETLEKMKNEEADIVILGFHSDISQKYGRLIERGGILQEIIEFNDASEDERQITLCNSGIFLVKNEVLKSLVPLISNSNSKGEFYLTDIVLLANKRGFVVKYILCEEEEVLGVNTRADLAVCEANMQNILRKKHMEAGTTLLDPKSVFFGLDTEIASDVIIEPNVIFGKNVKIEENCTIKAFSYIEDCHISEGVSIGPFARIRGKTKIGKESKIGNFVEIKNSTLESEVKAGHMAYIGDAKIGKNSNIGAGAVFCNYDGKKKHTSTLEEGVFVGSNVSIVSPVHIGKSALIGAGSVITKDVPPESLALERGAQKIITKYVKK